MFKKIKDYSVKLESRIRNRLSHHPVAYAFIGSIGIVLIWRGIWHIADDVNMPGWISLVLGVVIAAISGLFVSFFVGESIIISGIKKEKRFDQKTEAEIMKEEGLLEEIEEEIKEIKEEMDEIKKEI